VEFVLWLLTEGVDASVLVRFNGHADATLARWLERMGSQNLSWQNLLFRHLVLSLVQMYELYTRIRATASAASIWLAFDPFSKAIPSIHISDRTKDDALALVHDLKLRLALTAHFGARFRPPRARTDHWKPSAELYYGQLVKRKGKNQKTSTHTCMILGKPGQLFDRLRQVGLRLLIQTAFVERVNLTFWQSVAALSPVAHGRMPKASSICASTASGFITSFGHTNR
jgi:hypothetical protein